MQGRQYALPMATHDVLAKYCMTWGGDFRGTPDPMHAEIHCTPNTNRDVGGNPAVTSLPAPAFTADPRTENRSA